MMTRPIPQATLVEITKDARTSGKYAEPCSGLMLVVRDLGPSFDLTRDDVEVLCLDGKTYYVDARDLLPG